MSLTSNIWDRLGTLTPTRDAAVATSGGDCYEPTKDAGGETFLAPPLMITGPSALRPDLTGRRFGDLTVIGQEARRAAHGRWHEAAWVVRCACGNYALRRHSKLSKKDPSHPAACPTCTYTRQMLQRDQSSKGPSAKQLRREAARLDALAGGERS